MKMKTTVAALSVLSVLSFGAFAADSINANQAQNREAIGTVSVSGVASSPMDMREMLNKKAEEKGASAYQITEARSGDTARHGRTVQINPHRQVRRYCPQLPGAFFILMTHIKAQVPFQFFFRFIK